MERALLLAGRARGQTTPNPLVGAVVVTPDGVVAGTGYHARAGEPHAEVHALREAGGAARGATLYCTLEPCSHTGRTPPCVDRILESGVARVVAAVGDPNPRVSGRGFLRLREAGVRVEVGEGEAAARRLNRPFFSAMRRGRPYVIVKAVTSLDGRVAAGPGAPTRLSSPATDRRTHALRAEVDAIAIGSGTVLVDDPLLTARGVYRSRPLARVIFDRRLRTPLVGEGVRDTGCGPSHHPDGARRANRFGARARVRRGVGGACAWRADRRPAPARAHGHPVGARRRRADAADGALARRRCRRGPPRRGPSRAGPGRSTMGGARCGAVGLVAPRGGGTLRGRRDNRS